VTEGPSAQDVLFALARCVRAGVARPFPGGLTAIWRRPTGAGHARPVSDQLWVADVGVDNANWLATESRTARLAREYRPRDLGGGQIELSSRALGASRELGEEEDGYITDDGEGLRIWVGDDAFELEPVELE
jgi:hypothetical protein